ncbi:hypothetical protein Pmani_017933 [Petrolisthes manimaculis]|uniref:Uncharacterized protein n=1 Tax=Petrolisthes manimaculis TaxID=1843537 RepID=A0AAE1U8W2_9EUCA|nr:hypothetical protein Pmani_017933 [Petrolisthes manimaculis]
MGDLAYLLTSADFSVPWDTTDHAAFRSGLANLTRNHLTFLPGSPSLEHLHLAPDLDLLWNNNLNLILEGSGDPGLEPETDDLIWKDDLDPVPERDGDLKPGVVWDVGDLDELWKSDPDPDLLSMRDGDLDPEQVRRVILKLVKELRSMSAADLEGTHQTTPTTDLRRPGARGGDTHTGSWKATSDIRSQKVRSQVRSRTRSSWKVESLLKSRKVRSPQGHPLLPGSMMHRMMLVNPRTPQVMVGRRLQRLLQLRQHLVVNQHHYNAPTNDSSSNSTVRNLTNKGGANNSHGITNNNRGTHNTYTGNRTKTDPSNNIIRINNNSSNNNNNNNNGNITYNNNSNRDDTNRGIKSNNGDTSNNRSSAVKIHDSANDNDNSSTSGGGGRWGNRSSRRRSRRRRNIRSTGVNEGGFSFLKHQHQQEGQDVREGLGQCGGGGGGGGRGVSRAKGRGLVAVVALLKLWQQALVQPSPVCVAYSLCMTAQQLEESGGVGAVVGGVGVKAAALFLARERHINPQYLEWAVQRGRERGREGEEEEEEEEEEEDCSQLFRGCGEEKND